MVIVVLVRLLFFYNNATITVCDNYKYSSIMLWYTRVFVCDQLPKNRLTCLYKYSFLLTDINECNSHNGKCDQLCINKAGSYQCSCRTGYSLAHDEHTCNGKEKYTLYK